MQASKVNISENTAKNAGKLTQKQKRKIRKQRILTYVQGIQNNEVVTGRDLARYLGMKESSSHTALQLLNELVAEGKLRKVDVSKSPDIKDSYRSYTYKIVEQEGGFQKGKPKKRMVSGKELQGTAGWEDQPEEIAKPSTEPEPEPQQEPETVSVPIQETDPLVTPYLRQRLQDLQYMSDNKELKQLISILLEYIK